MDWWTFAALCLVAIVAALALLLAVHLLFWPDVPWARRRRRGGQWHWDGRGARVWTQKRDDEGNGD